MTVEWITALNLNAEGAGSETSVSSPSGGGELLIQQIVKRICAGEVDLFEVIVERYQNEVFSIAWQISRNYDDTCDIVQETFLRMYRALISWQGKAKFSTWVYRITLNTALDFLRREARHYRRRLFAETTLDGNQTEEQRLKGVDYTSPSETAQRHLQMQQIQELLLKLSPMQRKCFILHYFQELNITEISEVVRCSIGAVKRHLFRAKARLKKLLEEK
ncbi:MAG: RNA polymerase sigma factor [Candidatus Sumerlaeia bacterium]|nr:RNA polymerase sigma factor [Candidatus Sumerlaeia bacterium]